MLYVQHCVTLFVLSSGGRAIRADPPPPLFECLNAPPRLPPGRAGPPEAGPDRAASTQDVITNKGKGRADLTNLPRKINICISPSRDDFPHTHINDLGFQAVKNAAGEVVYNVEVGGYFSIKRNETSIPLGISVTKDQARSCCCCRCCPGHPYCSVKILGPAVSSANAVVAAV
jgi:Nitrite and sulphite reductase 4Fe-4S domain